MGGFARACKPRKIAAGLASVAEAGSRHIANLNIAGITQLLNLTINGNARQFDAADFTVEMLVARLGLTGKRLAIELNGEIVPRSTFAQTALNDGDKLEIVGAVGGG